MSEQHRGYQDNGSLVAMSDNTGPQNANGVGVHNVGGTVPSAIPPGSGHAKIHKRRALARRRLPRPLVWFLRLIGFIFILSLIAAGAGYFMLRQGPISLTFLVKPIEDSLNRELDGMSLRIKDVVVQLNARQRVELRLGEVVLSDASGVPVALAPQAGIQISGSALKRGKLAASRIDLIGSRMLLLQAADGSMSLSFSARRSPSDTTFTPSNSPSNQGVQPGDTLADALNRGNKAPLNPTLLLQRLDLAKTLADASSRARQRNDATSFLKAVGLRDTTIIFDQQGKRSSWQVPDFDIAFTHASRTSIITSKAVVNSVRGPWSFSFRSQDSEKTKSLSLNGVVANLVPATLARTLPQLALLDAFDMPVSGRTSMKLDTDGNVVRGDINLTLDAGNLLLPWLGGIPLKIDSGSLKVSYDNTARTITIAPSTIRWGGSYMTIAGTMQPAPAQHGADVWKFDINAVDGSFVSQQPGSKPMVLQAMTMTGWITPAVGRIQLEQFYINAGGAEIAVAADVVNVGGTPRARLEGRIGEMSLTALKALWPPSLAPEARRFIDENLKRGRINGGTFKLATRDQAPDQISQQLARQSSGTRANPLAMMLTLKTSDLLLKSGRGTPALQISRALVRLEGDMLEISAPKAAIIPAKGKAIALRSGRFVVRKFMSDQPRGELSFTTKGRIADAYRLARSMKANFPEFLQDKKFSARQLGGSFKGKIKIKLPLRRDLNVEELSIDGRLKILDGRVKIPNSKLKIRSMDMDIDLNSRAVNVSGQMLVNGIVAKLSGQRIFGLSAPRQPPLRITMSLDDADRAQFGMDINHLVSGTIPVEITVSPKPGAPAAINVRADLTQAELVLNSISWRKPPGQKTTLQFDVGRGTKGAIELQQFKLVGNNVAIEGWLSLDEDLNAREFYFPEFSINVVSRLQVQGSLSKKNVWRVKAKGQTFDGRDFFGGLFDFEKRTKGKRHKRKNIPGIHLTAFIDNVIGFGDVSLRGLNIELRESNDVVRFISAKGRLDGKAPLTVSLNPKPKARRILFAETRDAGRAFRLVGFYPNIRNGRATLKVNLDGKGIAETTGQLEVRKFSILGDAVVAEVLQNVDTGRPAIARRRRRGKRVARQRYDFDSMSAPFKVGQGQFVLEESTIRGPLIGASIRGKVDFKAGRLKLGGAYAPLHGLNAALRDFPLLGPLLTGPRGEGILGITFAIQGKISDPQVIVNPLSMLTPGFLRELMQLTEQNPKIQQRRVRKTKKT